MHCGLWKGEWVSLSTWTYAIPHTCAKGDGLGVFVTPSEAAFLSIRRAILGDLIWDKSMPPGVYVNGFLSFVIIAFWTHAGASGGI